jgi:fibronectin-binding autotransporter adhesin
VTGLTGAANSQNRTLTLGGNYTGGPNEIQGAIVNNTASIGLVNVEKTDASTWVLSGTNSYTGTTTVSGGTLLINGNSSTATGNVDVNAGTLGGIGRIGGAVSVAGGATLAPGASIESLAVASLSMTTGSTFAYEVANNSATGADLLAVGSTLSLTDVTLSLDATTLAALSGGGWNIDDKLTLISYLGGDITSGFTGYLDDTSYFFGANEWLFDYNDTVAGGNYATDAIAAGQNRFVTMTLIPEPSTALLGVLGLLALLRRRRVVL